MTVHDTTRAVVEAAERLVALVLRAPVVIGFDEEGFGPTTALANDSWGPGCRGPIVRAAERLAEALLDHEHAERMRALAPSEPPSITPLRKAP